MTAKNYKIGLKKNSANFSSLTPISFLERTANAFPNYTSIVSENHKFTWKSTFARCKLFASSLKKKKYSLRFLLIKNPCDENSQLRSPL